MKVPINGPEEEGKETLAASDEKEKQPAGTSSAEDIPTDDPRELARLLKEKTEEARAHYDRLLRLQADFENYKKRLEKEKAGYVKYANEGLIIELLAVLDDLERARASAEIDSTDERLLEGIKMIESKFKDVLDGAGVEEVQAVGEEFDPNYHEAVMTTPAEGNAHNMVTQELQKGYTLSGKVIRPAKVVVAVEGPDES